MEASSESKATVLYVDDIKANLMLFEASFDSEYNVLLAESGKEALKILAEEDIHVVVSDQNMPGMTGNELLEIITSDYPDIMRFMITAYTDYETVVEAINKGHLYGFFNKPYNIEDVKISIDKSVEVRNLRISNREMIEKLEKANEALLGIDKSKTNFLTSLTEEFRTPINKIMTAIHMIKDKIDSKELTELLHMLDASVSRLESFSEAAQQLARLHDIASVLDMKDVSIKELLEIAIIENGNVLSDEDQNVKLDAPEDDIVVLGEFDLLLACLTSILKYLSANSEKGAEIELRVSKDGGGLVSLGSTGSNFSDEEKVIFADYMNGDLTNEDNLTLEIVLAIEIMKAHNGKMSFADKGTKQVVFEMVFPVNED